MAPKGRTSSKGEGSSSSTRRHEKKQDDALRRRLRRAAKDADEEVSQILQTMVEEQYEHLVVTAPEEVDVAVFFIDQTGWRGKLVIVAADQEKLSPIIAKANEFPNKFTSIEEYVE